MPDIDLMALGRIEGKLDMIVSHLAKQDKKLVELDTRLRDLEMKASRNGAIYGGLAAMLAVAADEIIKRFV
ncbi:hypothetical protein HZU77_003130 [Neisseriaceae bacterium TC5R-5]|nr:hypothetical protein [Neisseriaceae bacterium TC5R-5]